MRLCIFQKWNQQQIDQMRRKIIQHNILQPYLLHSTINQLQFRCQNIMQRDINLRTPGSQKTDSQSIRLVDSRGKKPSNNKISIYSQKYALIQNPVQRQEAKVIKLSQKKETQHVTINLSNSRLKQPSIITRKQENHPKPFQLQGKSCIQINSQKHIEGNQAKNISNILTLSSLRQYVDEVRIFYQGKIKQITEDNAKTICELRNILAQQQLRIAEKQDIINKIVGASDKFKLIPAKTPNFKFHMNDSPNKMAFFKSAQKPVNQQHILNKIKDLQNKVKVFMDHFVESQQEVQQKIDFLQHNLLRHFQNRISKCWFRIGQFSQYLSQKCLTLDNQLAQANKCLTKIIKNSSQPDIQNYLLETNSKISQISKEIKRYSHKQCKQDGQRVQGLQTILISLMQKLDFLQKKILLQSSRRIQNGLFFEDQDEFFYPSSQRIYQPNDEYQHFQSQSQDQSSSFIKQNINDNCQSYARVLQKSKNC